MRIEGRGRLAPPGNWIRDNWQYVLLVLLFALAVFLVVLALNRPTTSFRQPTDRVSTPSSTPSPTPTPTPTSTSLPSSVPPSAAPAVVAFLGDSYTIGTGASSIDARWTTKIAERNGWTEVNVGVASTGYATLADNGGASYTKRVAEVVAAKPAVVIVSGGRFDYSGSSSRLDVSSAIKETFVSLRSGLPSTQIIALGPIWDASEAPLRLTEISGEVQAAAESVGGSFVDIGQPFAGQPSLIGSDGVLPNDAGYATLTFKIASAIMPIIADLD